MTRLGLSPFPRRQIPPSSKFDVELRVAESKMVNKKNYNFIFRVGGLLRVSHKFGSSKYVSEVVRVTVI